MKSKLAPLLVAIASSFLLVGCCTTQQCCSQHNAAATQWEYKVGSAINSDSAIVASFLNDAAKDGWIFVQRDTDGRCIFKRAKK